MKQNTNTKDSMKTLNKSGHVAYKLNPKFSLITKVLTSFFSEPKYYGDNSSEIVEEATQMAHKDPHFLANLTKYARKEFHMRSVTHILTAIMSQVYSSKPYVKEVVPYVVERPDDITEIVAAYLHMYYGGANIDDNKFTIPNSLKKSLANVFGKFNEYQLSKYNSQNKAVKLGDVIKLVHPKRNDLYKKVIEDNLETANRWETELSSKGNNSGTWAELIESGNLGYMALLRNLSNILNSNIDKKYVDRVCDMLSDENSVLNSKQLPFRYYSAYTMIKNNPNCTSKLIDALGNALKISTKSLVKEPLKGKTLIGIDVSGSMSSPLSRNGRVRCHDIARILGVISNSICEESILLSFDTQYKLISLSTDSNMLEQIEKIPADGGGTNVGLPLVYALKNNISFDRIIVLSDNEINSDYHGYNCKTVQSLLNQYRNNVNKTAYYYGIDLEGYGTSCIIPDKYTTILAGWSEKLLQFIEMFEIDEQTLINIIENYK